MQLSMPTRDAAKRAPKWPLLFAPFVGFAYYASIQGAFAVAISAVFKDGAVLQRLSDDLGIAQWGTHWFFRLLAEFVSIAFGGFVAAGFSRERAVAGALLGGSTISLYYAMRMAIMLFAPEGVALTEPWYQYLIDGLIVFAAPIVAFGCAPSAARFSLQSQSGFAGVARLHFLWLWFPFYWYAIALVPLLVGAWLASNRELGLLSPIWLLAYAAFAVLWLTPVYLGLRLMSGAIGHRIPASVRNVCGPLVMIAGFGVMTFLSTILVPSNWHFLPQLFGAWATCTECTTHTRVIVAAMSLPNVRSN